MVDLWPRCGNKANTMSRERLLRPSHKDDFLERTKAAREERQMEKIRGKEWRTQMVFKWLFIGLKQDSFPKKTCSSVVLRSRSFFDKLQFFSPAHIKIVHIQNEAFHYSKQNFTTPSPSLPQERLLRYLYNFLSFQLE